MKKTKITKDDITRNKIKDKTNWSDVINKSQDVADHEAYSDKENPVFKGKKFSRINRDKVVQK
ncbi:hypothetical protein [Sessilibacter sp. MAH4]